MFNDLTSLARYLDTRRSAKARTMVEPGPDGDQLTRIVARAIRTPDHGKLAPWRLVIIGRSDRSAFETLLLDALAARPDHREGDAEKAREFAHQAPCLVAVLSCPRPHEKVSRWDQRLSAGAVVMNLLHAARAEGFDACWLTGWAAEDARVIAALGGGPDDRVAGFVFLGTSAMPLAERARPAMDEVVRNWSDLRD